jgi:hypothetical protein
MLGATLDLQLYLDRLNRGDHRLRFLATSGRDCEKG